MSIETILTLVIGAFSLYFLYVITRKLILAVFFGAFISAVIFVVIPSLTHRDDALGEAARMVDAVTGEVVGWASELMGHPETKALVKKAKTEVKSLTVDTIKAVAEDALQAGAGGTSGQPVEKEPEGALAP